jgi:D-alanine-D-alanine ligase
MDKDVNMSITVDPDWWKTLFDEVYLITDARSVCNEDITRLEVDLICELLPIRRQSKILDLCGGHGRHSLELCTRGFSCCTLLDYSPVLINYAKARAAECNLSIRAVQSDARRTGFSDESFDHVFIMGNSLGYITGASDNQIMSEVFRLLRPGGWFLVDVTDGNRVKRDFNPEAWHEIDDHTVVCRKRELKGDTIHAREMVLNKKKGLIRDRTYAIRLYGSQTLALLLEKAGFQQVTVRTGFSPHESKGDYGFMNHRLLATGRKM